MPGRGEGSIALCQPLLGPLVYLNYNNKKHLKMLGPFAILRAVLHCHSPGVATAAAVARRLRIDVHDDDDDVDNDNA